MPGTEKDTIYIDADDEITTVIDKLQGSKQRIVALVLPKRAAMLQSSVNMKLLKRAAEDVKKQPVLITSEAGLLPLAGTIGLHVAKTLQSKPEIPEVDKVAHEAEADETLKIDENDFDSEEVADLPIGALAGLPTDEKAPVSRYKPELAPRPIPRAGAGEDDDTVEFDNTAKEATVATAGAGAATSKLASNKKLKVPNFERFRLRLILGVLLIVVLVVGWILANVILPKAVITVSTNSTLVNVGLPLTLDVNAKSVDPTNLVVPATIQQTQKTTSQQVAASGQQNEGTKATGSITITNCGGSDATVPAGTAFTSNGFTFISQTSVTVPDSNFTSPVTGSKCKNDGKASVNVTAQNGGASYNLSSGASYAISNNPGGLTAVGSAMSGGTDNVVQIVAQADIDSAKQKLSSADTGSVTTELIDALKGAGFYPLSATFNAGAPAITASANVGDQAANVTVTQVVTYTMFGAKQSDLTGLIAASVNKQIDTSKQTILDNGFSSANFSGFVMQSASRAQLKLTATATAGPDLNINSLKTQIVGKKSGDVKSIISNNPGVTGVNVKFSPFWVSSVPKKLSHVTITIEKPTAANANP